MNSTELADILSLSYKPQADASAAMEGKGYDYDPDLSSMDTKIFINKETKQPLIAYRGSVRANEWLDNLNLGLGGKSKHVDEAISTAQKVKEKYGQAPITIGHSRGGLMAEKAGEATGGKTYTYNKATLPTDIFKTIRKEQTDIRTNKDLVSLPSIFQRGGTKETIKLPSITNFIKAHDIKFLRK